MTIILFDDVELKATWGLPETTSCTETCVFTDKSEEVSPNIGPFSFNFQFMPGIQPPRKEPFGEYVLDIFDF